MKKNVYIVTLTFLCLCYFFCVNDPGGNGDGATGTIFGFVTDFRDGQPVGNANVQLRPTGQTIQTGSNGRFQFSNIQSGTYNITVTKSGYTDLVDPHNITVRADASSQRDVMIERQPMPLRWSIRLPGRRRGSAPR